MVDLVIEHNLPTGSMYAIYGIYGNIYHQYTLPPMLAYTIHGSYGLRHNN